MEIFKIEMTKDEMIRYYANKIVEDGIKNCLEFNIAININDYKGMDKYANEILNQIYRDERVADVNLDDDGNFDMVFYTDFCPFYYDEEDDKENIAFYHNTVKGKIIENFIDYYRNNHLFGDPYVSTRRLIDEYIENTDFTNKNLKSKLSNMLKTYIIKSGFIDKNIENTEAYVTPKNYKEFENLLLRVVSNEETQESQEEM